MININSIEISQKEPKVDIQVNKKYVDSGIDVFII
jgi:hypothetical protein